MASRISRRNTYALIFLIGFALRLGFVIWAHTYVGDANTTNPFGAEVCRIAVAHRRGRWISFAISRRRYRTERVGSASVSVFCGGSVPALRQLLSRVRFDSVEPAMRRGGRNRCGDLRAGQRSLGQQVGFWAAWIWTLSPIFFRWPATWIWDFAASALLLTLAFIVTLDTAENGGTANWLRLAGVWGLSALTNPALLSLLPFSFFHAAWANHKSHPRYIRRLIYAVILFGAIVSPWLVRNYLVFGQAVFLRDNFWFEFSLGNYRFSNGMGWAGKHPDNNPLVHEQVVQLGEPAFIEYHKKEALDFVRQYPREFLGLSLRRAWWFWDGTSLSLSRQRMVEAVGILAALPRRLAGIVVCTDAPPPGLVSLCRRTPDLSGAILFVVPATEVSLRHRARTSAAGGLSRFCPVGRDQQASHSSARELKPLPFPFLSSKRYFSMKTILVVDDEPAARYALNRALENRYRIVEADSAAAARSALDTEKPDLMLLDVVMPGEDGLAFLKWLRAEGHQLPVLMVSALDTAKPAVEALQFGAADYLVKGFELEELRTRVANLLKFSALQQENSIACCRRLATEGQFGQMIGRSAAMRRAFELADRVARQQILPC